MSVLTGGPGCSEREKAGLRLDGLLRLAREREEEVGWPR